MENFINKLICLFFGHKLGSGYVLKFDNTEFEQYDCQRCSYTYRHFYKDEHSISFCIYKNSDNMVHNILEHSPLLKCLKEGF
jgi:predicted nucleic-acid-binding Zn-ribbon protein